LKTLVISDLHIGTDSVTPIYDGDRELPALIGRQSHPLRVILNGDTLDLLLDDDPLVLDVAAAREKVTACLKSAAGAELVSALADVLAKGGEVMLRAGNHDLELALPDVQAAVRDVFAARGVSTAGLAFSNEDRPLVLEVGGHRVLVTHGEHGDLANAWRHDNVRAALVDPGGFLYPPGSILVKDILNPLKKQMRFLDLLKPDFHGAILTALAVRPLEVRRILSRSTLDIIAGVAANLVDGAAFGPTGEPPTDPFGALVTDAELTSDEAAELVGFLDGDSAAFSGADGDSGIFRRVLDKLGRAALRAYAATHRWIAGAAGAAFFDETPADAEWDEAVALSEKFGAHVVVAGHSHARRYRIADGRVYVNTGTWITLLELPGREAPVAVWATFLDKLRADPMLTDRRLSHLRGAACVIDPQASDLESAVELLRVDRSAC
jgi:UDP-2,3-diacylglucosamine pyrophosphatase LpxH